MRKVKIWYMGKRLKDIYPYATRWELIKYKLGIILNWAFLIAFFSGSVLGAYHLGWLLNPRVTYADREVQVKDMTMPPVMVRIAQCESNNSQTDKNGQVLINSTRDIGKYQINVAHWGKIATQNGWDLSTSQGNENMARYIYEHNGTGAWQSSAKCWNK